MDLRILLKGVTNQNKLLERGSLMSNYVSYLLSNCFDKSNAQIKAVYGSLYNSQFQRELCHDGESMATGMEGAVADQEAPVHIALASRKQSLSRKWGSFIKP